jgi:hypothetical protein
MPLACRLRVIAQGKETSIMTRNKFSYRASTSLIITWTFLLLIISGTILFVAPPGRITNWTNWRILAFTKAQWQGVHALSAIIFLTGGLFHLLKFNWKVFVAYANRKGETGWRYRKEFAVSVALVAIVVAGTLIEIPPFASVMIAGEKIKNSWSTPTNEPPTPHMELLTVRQIAEKAKGEPEKVVTELNAKGIRVENSETKLSEVSKKSGKSPQEICSLVKKDSPVQESPVVEHQEGSGGRGYGVKKLS